MAGTVRRFRAGVRPEGGAMGQVPWRFWSHPFAQGQHGFGCKWPLAASGCCSRNRSCGGIPDCSPRVWSIAAQLLFGLPQTGGDPIRTLGCLVVRSLGQLAAEGRRGLLQQLEIPRIVVQRTHQGAVKTRSRGAVRVGIVISNADRAGTLWRSLKNFEPFHMFPLYLSEYFPASRRRPWV